jgi:hypothetical protein
MFLHVEQTAIILEEIKNRSENDLEVTVGRVLEN